MPKEKTAELKIPQDILDSVKEIAEVDYQAALRYYKEKKEKASEPKISFVETGKVKLIVRVPNLSQENARIVARDVRFTLENSAKLNSLNEFVMTTATEYIEK